MAEELKLSEDDFMAWLQDAIDRQPPKRTILIRRGSAVDKYIREHNEDDDAWGIKVVRY